MGNGEWYRYSLNDYIYIIISRLDYIYIYMTRWSNDKFTYLLVLDDYLLYYIINNPINEVRAD